jgi:c-di-GMP-binding flagellar brake protein YcgR
MTTEAFDFYKGKRVSIDIGTQLQVSIEGVDYKYISTLIGMEPDKYLIIHAQGSMINSARHKLFRGSKLLIRYLYKGSAFGFQSELIQDIYAPLKLLFLKYPEIIEEHNFRSGERIACVLPIKIKINNEEKTGIIQDLSKKGCSCIVKEAEKDKKLPSVQIDEQVTLICQFPLIEGTHAILGKVRNFRIDNKQLMLGIMFNEVKPELEDLIGQYIVAVS